MESNSDKQLRDKLTGAEFPFDPAAWDSMEAMLDKKKKRRGFFWWWTGGIAAALLLGVAGYEIGMIKNQEPRTKNQENTRLLTGHGQRTTENTGTITKNSVTETQNPENTIGKSGTGDGGQEIIAENSGNRNQKLEKPISKNEKQQVAKNKAEKESNNKQVAQNKKPGKQKSSSAANAKPGDGFVAFNGNGGVKNKPAKSKAALVLTTDKGQPVTVLQQEAQMLTEAGAAGNVEQPANLQRMEASLFSYVSENAITGLDKKEEDVLPKMKKGIFNYSLGVLANVTGTTLGKQTITPNVPIRNRTSLFYNRPSFMVGFTHDFLFVNRVAITNSILYSQTSFEVLKPKSENYPVTLTYYSSRISELTIPIGVKVYPVVKKNFKFYINTGIINHIKLKETFDYKVVIDTQTNANLGMQPDQFFPTSNSFDPNTKAHDVYSGVTNTETTTDDFSINKSKRYYASFYAGAGVEYIAKKQVVLFCEPMFYMNLQKIGVQDKRKYNFGVSGGLRYQF